MRGLLPLAWDNWRHSWRSQVATALAVALSVAFIVVIVSLGGSLNRSLERQVAEPFAGADLAVGCTEMMDSGCADASAVIPLVRDLPGVQDVAAWDASFVLVDSPSGEQSYVSLRTVLPPLLRTAELSAGEWPDANRDEVVLDASLAESLHVSVGDTFRVQLPWLEEPESRDVRLVGLVDSDSTGDSWLLTGAPFAAEQISASLTLISVADGADVEQVRTEIETALVAADSGDATLADAAVLTAEEGRELAVESAHGYGNADTWFFMVFAVVALLLSVAIVSTTSAVTLQRRRREMALLRCTGATSSQLRRLLLWESALVGLIAGALGLALAAVVVAFGFPLIDVATDPGDAVSIVSPTTALLALGLSVAVCVLASLRAVRASARVSPMMVLASAEVAGTRVSPRRRRQLGWVAAAVLAVLGGIAAWVGVRPLPDEVSSYSTYLLLFMLAVLGGVALLLAVLVATVLLVPRVGGPASRLLRRQEAARVGALGVRQSGGRAGATAAIMLVGVALVVATFTGAATMRASVLGEIATRRPVDVYLSTSSGSAGFTDAQLADLAAVDGVAEISRSQCVSASFTDVYGDESDVQVVVVNPAEWQVVARAAADVPDAGAGLVDQFGLLQDESSLDLVLADGEELTLPVSAAPTRTVEWNEVRVNSGTLPQGALADAQSCVVWLRVNDNLNSDQADALLADVQAVNTDAALAGGLSDRLYYEQMLNRILLVVLGLLAISLVVCVVGLTNVLFLGVGERGRELAILRAVGMTRKQTAVVVLTEGLVLASVALLLGIVTGVGLGLLAADAVVVQMADVELHLAVPVWQIVATALMTLLVSGVAAVFPAWRASRISPVTAMSAE